VAKFHCVKCGALTTTIDPRWREHHDCAPACEKCRGAVTRETLRGASMWPFDYYGKWIWSKRAWWPNKNQVRDARDS
jgi:hypothetical protein